MSTIDSRSISRLSLDIKRLLKEHPRLIDEIASYSLIRLLYSRSRIPRLNRFNKRQLRKLRNSRRRWFVDNIIMHHRRIHDKQDKLIKSRQINNLAKNKDESRNKKIITYNPRKKDFNCKNSWQENYLLKERGQKIRGRIDARRLRARSRWVSILNG